MQKKSFAITGFLCVTIAAAVAATKNASPAHKNLKILPADISAQKLDSIMESYNKALGVKCNFCHAKANGFSNELDYASDKEPMKENARDMMRMVIDINKNYFNYDTTKRPEYLNTIHCNTCHRGEPFPPEK